jgi:hypothetical protein
VRGRILMQFRGRGPWTLLKSIAPCTRKRDAALDPSLWLNCSSQVFSGPLEHVDGDVFAAIGTTPPHSTYPGTRYRVELRIQSITHAPVFTE